MKKAINKTERDFIIKALVVEAAVRSAQDIITKLGALRSRVFDVLLSNWEDSFPGISRADQLELLQSHGAHTLVFKPDVLVENATDPTTTTKTGEFAKLHWSNVGSDTAKQRIASAASKIVDACTGTAGVITEGVTTGYASALLLNVNYVGLINGKQPRGVYLGAALLPEDYDSILNSKLSLLHKESIVLLTNLRDVVLATEDAYQSLHSALAPVKTAQQLADLMPEAIKFFPPSLTYVKPTKEIADPKAINDIRAKLKAGLPI